LRFTEIKAFVQLKNFEISKQFMMHIPVEDADAWWQQVRASGVVVNVPKLCSKIKQGQQLGGVFYCFSK
jgi:hypothetical protein